MIYGFYSDNNFHQLGVVMMNMLDEIGLCTSWPRNKNSASVCNRFSHRMKVILIGGCVPAPYGVCLMMDVPRRVIRM